MGNKRQVYICKNFPLEMCAVECVDIQLHKFKITQITKFDFVFCLSCWETIGVLLAKIFLPPPKK